MHVPCIDKFQGKTSVNVFPFYMELPNYSAAAVLLIQVHYKIKNYL